ncbi:MAG: HAMP domain-containing protein, partial [Porticoccaceae bacterium]
MASLVFSVVVFYEMAEQPFNLLDTVLQEEATRVVRTLVNAPKKVGERKGDVQPLGLDQYWLEVWDAEGGRLLFRSALAGQIRLASLAPGSSAILQPLTAKKRGIPPWRKGNPPVFRVKTWALDMEGQKFRVQIGRPMEKLNEEIWDVFFGLLAGLIFSTLVLGAISRSVAGKILLPVQQIKELTKEISEHNLSQRIPLREPGDEINELAKTINLMLERLQYSFDRQRGFLYATSHELKTPLATMRLAVEEILSRETASVSAPAWDALLRISHQSLRLERLVNDLLTLSSLETLTGIECHPVDLSGLLHSLVEDFGVVAEARHIGINCAIEPDCRVQGSSKM